MLKISDASVIFQSLNETCGRRLLANTAELGLPATRGETTVWHKVLRALIFGIFAIFPVESVKTKNYRKHCFPL